MAEAKNAADLFYVQKGGFNLFGEGDKEDGYYKVNLSIPTPRTIFKVSKVVLRRASHQVTARFWPASPMTVLAVVGGVTATTVRAKNDSWLRSGWLAEMLWKGDKVINRFNPLHSHFTVNTRVAYLAAITAVIGMVGIVTVERILLKVALTWQGWLYLPPGTKKKPWSVVIWAACVKLFSGHKNLTYAFSMSLPSLPVPPLKDTVARYLDTVEPLLTPEEFENQKATANAFLKQEGPRLQRYLHLKRFISTNYVSDWWEKYVYLRGRTPLMINSNYYVLDSDRTPLALTQLERAASVTSEFLQFKDMVESETLEPMVINGLVPLCMEQYARMFGTTRIPGRECDAIKHNVSRYIAVMSHGHWYKLDVYHGARGTHLSPYSSAEILHQLKLIRTHSSRDASKGVSLSRSPSRGKLQTGGRIQSFDNLSSLDRIVEEKSVEDRPVLETDIAAFTAGPRARWAEVREVFFGDGINRKSLAIIEKACMTLILDDESPMSLTERGKSLFHGNGSNRWFDKSINLVVFADGHAGLNCEHTWADAPVIAHLWEHSLLNELDRASKAKIIVEGTDGKMHFSREKLEEQRALEESKSDLKSLKPPQRLVWDFDEELIQATRMARTFAMEQVQDVELNIVEQSTYGKGFMKKCKVSPDGYIQMALQLAYYKDRGSFGLTYEASMTRLFRQGRTETVRTLSKESAKFVHGFYDKNLSAKEKLALLRTATDQHQAYYRNCMTGKGVDRHLFGLYVVSKGLDVDSKFLADALSAPWRLSTSQQPQQQTMLRKSLPKLVAETFRSPGGGFGPVAEDGYGVSYMVIGEDTLFFHISAKKNSGDTDAKRFGKHLLQALHDLRVMFDEVNGA